MSCTQHSQPLTFDCITCRIRICDKCIQSHTALQHQLIPRLEQSKRLFRLRLSEMFTSISTRLSRSELLAPDIAALDSATQSLEIFIANLSAGLSNVRAVADSLRSARERRKSLPDFRAVGTDLCKIMRTLDSVGAAGELAQKEQQAETVFAGTNCGYEIATRLDTSAVEEVVRSLANVQGEIRAIDSLAAAVAALMPKSVPEPALDRAVAPDKLDKKTMHKIEAKFSADRYGSLWEIRDSGNSCKKTEDPYIISICPLDTVLAEGRYEISYKVEELNSADPSDSIGICTKTSLAKCAFVGEHMYEVHNRAIFSDAKKELVRYYFARGDVLILFANFSNRVVTVVYDSGEATLEFLVNGRRLGSTIHGVPRGEYLTGVAFRSVGTKISFISFVRSPPS